MKIRQKIILYFSTIIIALVGLFFIFIYSLFADYRKEEFQERLKDKTSNTIKFLSEVQQIDHDILRALDRFSINNLYEEKSLLFDEKKNLIYSSIDDTKIEYPVEILNSLSATDTLIETREGDFDLVAVRLNFKGKIYYSLVKAYDTFGYTKLNYLKYVLLITFVIISMIIFLITFYLSRQISQPLNKMAAEIRQIHIEKNQTSITVPDTKDEIHFLAVQFNEQLSRLNDAFKFQKNIIHHFSHELKTPISILVSNFEKIEKEQDPEKIKMMMIAQKEGTKNLGEIINSLLQISKAESGNRTNWEQVRVDEILYDVVAETHEIDAAFQFDVQFVKPVENEDNLIVFADKRLLETAFRNLVLNCMHYSSDKNALITIKPMPKEIEIRFLNHGRTIGEDEKKFIFSHFFRGQNSSMKQGFGLGLVLISKIISIHDGTVTYSAADTNTNEFLVSIPLK